MNLKFACNIIVALLSLQVGDALHRSMSPLERMHIFGESNIDEIPEYWIDRPRKFPSEHPDVFLYNVSYKGGVETFRLHRHLDLFSDGFHMLTRNENASSLSPWHPEHECVFQGESLSTRDTRIGVVGCGDRMHGMIVTADGEHLLLHPHSASDDHVIHKRSVEATLAKHTCLFDKHLDPYPEDRRIALTERYIQRSPRLAVLKDNDLTIELAVFADDAMWRHFVELHGPRADAEMHRFIVAAVNNIDILYGQRSINPKVNVKIVRYEVLKVPPASLSKRVHRFGDVDKLLDNFCAYQASINPPDDHDPKHWDHALLFSGYDLYRDGLKTVAGYAPVKGMCSETRSCTINEGLDFGSVFVVTHEMGHSLGMYHDGDNQCDLRCCIMSPSVGTGKTQWSQCSVKEFHVFVAKLGAPARPPNCLRDSPLPSVERPVIKDRDNPGQQFTLGEQCAIFHGECWKHELRDGQLLEEVCEMVWCGNGEGIIRTAHPALEGTNCGLNRWCRNGLCIPSGQPLPAVHGAWSSWNEQPGAPCRGRCSDCEIDGQLRIRRSTRLCNRPAPNNGGQFCVGDDARGLVCDSKVCSGVKIDEYASGVCTGLRNAPDNPNPQLAGSGLQFSQAPCKVWCQLEASNNIRTVANFPDGTPCGDGAYCIKGECRPLLCNRFAIVESERECPPGVRYRPPTANTVLPEAPTSPAWTGSTQPPPPSSFPSSTPSPPTTPHSELQRILDAQSVPPRLLQHPLPPGLTTQQHPTVAPTPQLTPPFASPLSSQSAAPRQQPPPAVPKPSLVGPPPPAVRPPMWSLWSEWSSCIAACGEKGARVRIRDCWMPQGVLASREDACAGPRRDTQRCQAAPCSTAQPVTTRSPPAPTNRLPRSTPDGSSGPTITAFASTVSYAVEYSSTTSNSASAEGSEKFDDNSLVPFNTEEPPPEVPTPRPVDALMDTSPFLQDGQRPPADRVAAGARRVEFVDIPQPPPPSTTRASKPSRRESAGSRDIIDVAEPRERYDPRMFRAPPPPSPPADFATEDAIIEIQSLRNRGQPPFPRLINLPDDYGMTSPPLDNIQKAFLRQVAAHQLVPDPRVPGGFSARPLSIHQLVHANMTNLANLSRGSPMMPARPDIITPRQQPVNRQQQGFIAQDKYIRDVDEVEIDPFAGRSVSPSTSAQSSSPTTTEKPPSRDELDEELTEEEIELAAALFGTEDSPPKSPIHIARDVIGAAFDSLPPGEKVDSPILRPSPPPSSVHRTVPSPPRTNGAASFSDDPQVINQPLASDRQSQQQPNSPRLPQGSRANRQIRVGNPPQQLHEIPLTASQTQQRPDLVPEFEPPTRGRQVIYLPAGETPQQHLQVATGQRPERVLLQPESNTFPTLAPTGFPTLTSTPIPRTSYRPLPSSPPPPSPPPPPPPPRSFSSVSPYVSSTPSFNTYPTSLGYVASTLSPVAPLLNSAPIEFGQPAAFRPPPPEWGPWSECSVTCGRGLRTRRIDVCGGDNGEAELLVGTPANFAPVRGKRHASLQEGQLIVGTPITRDGAVCSETEECEMEPCWHFSEWSDWTECSKECGMGFALRRRVCVIGPCPGPLSESRRCIGVRCERPSVWAEWGVWSACSASCGIGTKFRERFCDSHKCFGSNREARRCQISPCVGAPDLFIQPEEPLLVYKRLCFPLPASALPNDLLPVRYTASTPPLPHTPSLLDVTLWGNWAQCSVTCGLGTTIRRHRTTGSVQHKSCFVVSCEDVLRR